MGWLWSSGATPKGNAVDTVSTTTTTTTTTMTTVAENQSVSSTAYESTYTDPEIAKFMAQIQAEFGDHSNSSNTPKPTTATTSSSTSSSQPAPSSSWWPSRSTSSEQPTTSSPPPLSIPTSSSTPAASEPVRLDPLSEALLPTTMSCRQAFDTAFHCNSLGGQWTAVYRAGTVRSCSEQWDDFWFCMRTRAYSGAVKEEAIRDYYRQKELKKYGPGMPNSTDVWEPRTEKLPPGTTFQGRYVKPDISDEEWRRLEIERRRTIQRQLREEEEERR
ncbi:hypothetical protein F5Y09DRAFT_322763 [Xylaria sp. FL1042]|nr:hypothetical protein F5Y09DRAFT_322763 [Xylaria sp. FL1042]